MLCGVNNKTGRCMQVHSKNDISDNCEINFLSKQKRCRKKTMKKNPKPNPKLTKKKKPNFKFVPKFSPYKIENNLLQPRSVHFF